MEEKQFQELIGELIKAKRLQKGLSKKELGLKLNYAPNSAGQVISKIESGKIAIPQKKIVNLIKVLGITHEELGINDLSIPIEIVLTSPKAITSILTGGVGGIVAAGIAVGPGPVGIGAAVGGLLGGLVKLFGDVSEDINEVVEENVDNVEEKINELCKGDEKKKQAILKILDS